MNAVSAIAAVAIAALAAGLVLLPFRRGGAPALERLADPLEDERLTLLRSIRDLDDEHRSGGISDDDYRSLRHDTEVRAVAVLKALAARDDAPQPAFRDLRSVSGNGHGSADASTRRRHASVPVFVVLAAAVAVGIPLLAGSLTSRSAGQAITGDQPGPASLAFFVQRVREHPADVAARLDLASRYQARGDLTDATAQYLAALRLNPRNAEANASVGELLYLSGDASTGLRYARRSLAVDPTYPEGLYVEGVILANALHRPGRAAAALRAYLEAAPYGSHRTEVLRLLDRIR